MLIKTKAKVHPWIRLNRVIRDIPSQVGRCLPTACRTAFRSPLHCLSTAFALPFGGPSLPFGGLCTAFRSPFTACRWPFTDSLIFHCRTSQYILGGVNAPNMRQGLLEVMEQRGLHCNCIRCREVGDNVAANAQVRTLPPL